MDGKGSWVRHGDGSVTFYEDTEAFFTPCPRTLERDAIVKWLRAENKLCDCHAHSEGECACGVWWREDKEWALTRVANAIERGDHIKD